MKECSRRKVLIITYYWPPSGGSGVQRMLKTVKYIRDFGWEPVVLTAANAAYPVHDESLIADVPEGVEVLKCPIWEPYELYKLFTGQKRKSQIFSGFLSEDKKLSLKKRASIWIRGNIFIPDSRVFWIGPATRLVKSYLAENSVDAIISSGPPHTAHLVARNTKRDTGLPWLADFRDPWRTIVFYHQLMLTKWADNRHKQMERSVLREADRVTTVSSACRDELSALGATHVDVVYNGFDPDDFDFEWGQPEAEFCFNHIGFLSADRNPAVLWEAFGELCRALPELRKALRLRFIGKTDYITFSQLEEQGLSDIVECIDYIPHNEALRFLCRAQVLLLPINDVPNVKGVITGKIFEYIASRRPVFAIGPEDAEFADILATTRSGFACHFLDKDKMKREILRFFRLYQKGELKTYPTDISRYSRRHAAEQIGRILDDMVASRSWPLLSSQTVKNAL